MEKAHWLSRKRASLKLAESAAGSEARLAHYELAGRYSVKAASIGTPAIAPANALPQPVCASVAKLSFDDAERA